MMYEKQGLYVDEGHLEAFAENYARGITPVGFTSGRSSAALLRKSLRKLEALSEALQAQQHGRPGMPSALRWLTDNLYLLRQEVSAAAGGLRCAEGLRFADRGTVLHLLCSGLLQSGLGEFSEVRLALFLRGFQKALILEQSELGLLTDGLKAAIVDSLERLYREMLNSGSDPEAQAADLFTALRSLSAGAYRTVMEAADLTEQLLLTDPAGVYPKMSRQSRADYRARLTALARQRGIPEHIAAKKILTLAESAEGEKRHVGWWLLREPLGNPPRLHRGGGYIAANVLSTAFLALLTGFLTKSPTVFFLLLIPLSELVKQSLDFLLLHLTKPIHIPRLSLRDGVPSEGKTLCVISALLNSEAAAAALATGLEQARLRNRDAGENLLFALLADLPESREEPYPGQDAILNAAAASIRALNERYGGGFFLFTRPRTVNSDGLWSPWERKRGGLLELMRFLRHRANSLRLLSGAETALEGVRYLLVLDSDTGVSPGSAKALIGTMLHPLNRPEIDSVSGIVRAGYGILAPRIGVTLSAAGRSDFSRIFAGQGGCDPYGSDCSELGMDLFGRGSFAGKGILDIDVFLSVVGDKIQNNSVLSHDVVESSFLRCGFVGNVELYDGFPGSVISYFRRLERWTRGDWQNLPFLFRSGRQLARVERWRFFDALRRSLVPVTALACIVFGFLRPGLGSAVAAAAALIVLLSELLLCCAETLLRSDRERGQRFRSALFVGLGGGLVRCFIRLLLLPAQAWVCTSAALRALWRMGISHRHLLQWQTSGESEAIRSDLLRNLRELWFAPLLGIGLVLLSPGIIGKTAGLLWLFTPLCAYLLSLPAETPVILTREERSYLTDCVRDTWQYFAEFLRPADHDLPPDNHQSLPPAGLARRSSPTNMGLALLSILAAMDLKLIGKAEGLAQIGRTLDTLEALPKWNGHLYNWYRTDDCSPLEPRYVSTVDSGNLCACLLTLSSGLREYSCGALSRRAKALADGMDFSLLYDRKQQLLHIGMDVSTGKHSEGHYDLMASEARLTAYLAAARGDVPIKIWQNLSRCQKQFGRYRGLASWTGTMFEYLMPELLLPLRHSSLLWESARFCLFVQRRRVRGTGLPWGISESAYRALDPGMSYRYKAHGCAHLALKPGMDDELVLSPYSSFLALCVRPHAAISNLRALEQLGMRDRFGFWEALDCTGMLTGSEPRQKQVCCVMAHHAGMSIVAAANALCGGSMQRRFLADPAMGAFTCLLEERVPIGGSVLQDADAPSRLLRPAPEASPVWEQGGDSANLLHPACCLLAGEAYTLLVTESGITRPRWGSIAPYCSPFRVTDPEKGMAFFWESEGTCLSLLPDGDADSVHYGWRFSTHSAAFSALWASGSSLCSLILSRDTPGELRTVRLQSGNSPSSGTLYLRFRPLLALQTDYDSHPAFWGLGISAKTVDGCLLLRRLPRKGMRELWMCLRPSHPCRYELTPGSDTGRAARRVFASDAELFLTEPVVTASCPVTLRPDAAPELRFALSMAYSEADALRTAAHILQHPDSADLPRQAAAILGMTAAEVSNAFAMLPELSFPTVPQAPALRSALWQFGISGDLPILCARYELPSRLSAAKALMNSHLFLSGCGCDFDLVFLTADGADYHRPLHTALGEALWRAGGELLRDAKGGVHLVEDSPEAQVISSLASLRLTVGQGSEIPVPASDTQPIPQAKPNRPLQRQPRFDWGDGRRFMFYVNHSLPSRTWQLPLTNGHFGYLATDCGIGHLWMDNAREQQITPWIGRPSATCGPERLWLELPDGRSVGLFAAPEDSACRVSYLPGAAIWEKRTDFGILRTTAFVPRDINARVLSVSAQGLPEGTILRWEAELRMGSCPEDARCCVIAPVGDGLCASAPTMQEKVFAFSHPAAERTDAPASVIGGLSRPMLAMRIPVRRGAILVCGCGEPEQLRELCRPGDAERALNDASEHWNAILSVLQIKTPSRALDRIMNGWCAYQTLACRMMARCSIYQSGGAYGFRDQLQDAVNLIGLDAAPARKQILRCCARQYEAGDVQHWWHHLGSETKGIRSRCSDDLLWLPWAVCEYTEKTGDLSLCEISVSYLSSPVLSPEESERYESALPGAVHENVLGHCLRALALVMKRGCGSHGLLKMGSGDWNDGFNAVNGESQWLSWFFLSIVRRILPLCDRLGTAVPGLAEFAKALCAAADRAWDGGWYLRGYYADGSPLGSHRSPECQIDSIAQSWAVLSGCADPEKADAALSAAVNRLYDREHRLIRLFDPPFAGKEHPGYLSAYGPGFRENGGQYTHAALWLVLALLERDRREEAVELLSALLPGENAVGDYLCEPYVLAADVSSAPGHVGEGGWSWYTGSAGWLWRIVTESLLGLKLRDGLLYLRPRLPKNWPGCAIRYFGHDIAVCGDSIRVDGSSYRGQGLPLRKE